jgi:hypothetical protein
VSEDQGSFFEGGLVALEDSVVVLGRVTVKPDAPVQRRPWVGRYDAAGNTLWAYELDLAHDRSVEPHALAVDCAGVCSWQHSTTRFRHGSDASTRTDL